MRRFWRIVGWLLLIYLIFLIIRSPTQAADLVRTAFDFLAGAVRAIAAFFDSLLARR